MSKKIEESMGRSKNNKKTTKERPMIVRVTKNEFELSDGRIFPMMFDFDEDEVPTPQEFQKQYDKWLALFQEMELTGNEPKSN